MIGSMPYNEPTPGLVNALTCVRPGELTLIVPTDTKIEHTHSIITQIAMSMGLRYEWNVVRSPYAPLHWTVVVRRISAFSPDAPTYVAAKLKEIDDTMRVARFFRRKLFGVLEQPDKIIEYYTPDRPNRYHSDFLASPHLHRDFPIGLSDNDSNYSMSCPAPCAAPSEESSIKQKVSSIFKRAERFLPSPDIDESGIEESFEDEKKRWVDALSALIVQYVAHFHEVPPMEMITKEIRGKLLLNSSKLSPITVSGDMKIYLPELNEIQLRMTPLATTVYIIFLCHPEGIRLKDIGDYRDQLIEIYSMVKPGSNDRIARRSIDELVNPLGNSLQEKLSMTRRSIKRYILDKEMAENYLITGERGGLYRINLDPSLINLPAILHA